MHLSRQKRQGMKLRQLKVHNFGKLNDKEMSFEDGINIVYGANESGKTTFHAFIKGMFYGITRQRGRASRNDLYTRYEPWENNSYFSGVLRFESGGKDFRITRNFYKNDIKEEFVCESDGERLSIEHGDMDVLLGDVSETVFDNTISIGQMRGRTDESLYSELRNYMTNYEGSGDWALDMGQALKSLKNQKKEYDALQRLDKTRQEARKRELQMNIDYLQNEIAGYEEKATNAKKELADRERAIKEEIKASEIKASEIEANEIKVSEIKANTDEAKAKTTKTQRTSKIKASILKRILYLSPIFLVVAIELFFYDEVPIRIRVVAGIIATVAAIMWWIIGRLDKRTVDVENGRDYETIIRDVGDSLEHSAKLLEGKLEQLEEMYEEKKTQLDNCQMDYWEYTANTGEVDENQVEIDALQLAMDSISRISATGTHRMEKQFHQRISDILKEITNGKYDRVVLDDKHEIELYSTEKQIPLWTLSKGTIEQVYFALRMAASEIFCTEDMPILLDDVFVMYDEDRLSSALTWLANNKTQVIIFTCNTREAQLAEKLKLSVTNINL